jgi:hypothetical protein
MAFIQAKNEAAEAVRQAANSNPLMNDRVTDKGLAAVAASILALAVAVNEANGRS